MKRLLAIFGFVAFVTMVSAQEADELAIPAPKPIEPQIGGVEMSADSLHLPVLNSFGQPYIGLYPMMWGGLYNWQLHEGINMNLGASVFASFGKNAPRGAGFQQNVSLMYAVPVTDRLSLAFGGYLDNLTWQHENWRDVGLSAVLGYRFTDQLEGYLYGQKSLTPRPNLFRSSYFSPSSPQWGIRGNHLLSPSFYDFTGMGDRIGAAFRYHFTPSFSIQVAVEQRIY